MVEPCDDCGGATEHVRQRFEIPLRWGRMVADEVPALRCTGCGRTDPAQHVLPRLEAVVELASEVPGATARTSLADVPLLPDGHPEG